MLKVMKSLFFVFGSLLVQYVLIKKSIKLMKGIVFGSKNLMTLMVSFCWNQKLYIGMKNVAMLVAIRKKF